MKGKVKFFDETKGYGFITPDEGEDIFVHSTSLAEGTTLRENDSVEFDVEQGDRGSKAINVKVVEGNPSEEENPSEEASE